MRPFVSLFRFLAALVVTDDDDDDDDDDNDNDVVVFFSLHGSLRFTDGIRLSDGPLFAPVR